MNCRLTGILAALFFLIACDKKPVPVMGGHTVLEVDIKELSGLCFNNDSSALLACGDKGVVKSVTFTGEVTEM